MQQACGFCRWEGFLAHGMSDVLAYCVECRAGKALKGGVELTLS